MNTKHTTPHANRRGEGGEAPTWIWYPGDFEIWLGNIFNNRRTERGAMFPPFWKQDSHWVTVEFSKAFMLEEEETITITCEGQYNFALDGKLQFPAKTYRIPAGEHKLNLKVWNQATPPALFIDGKTIKATPHGWQPTKTSYGLTRMALPTAQASTCPPHRGTSTVLTRLPRNIN